MNLLALDVSSDTLTGQGMADDPHRLESSLLVFQPRVQR